VAVDHLLAAAVAAALFRVVLVAEDNSNFCF
jgi:hypothetical protein